MDREYSFKLTFLVFLALILAFIVIMTCIKYNILINVIAGISLFMLTSELMYRVSNRRLKIMNVFGANYYKQKARNRKTMREQWILNLINKIRK